MKKYHWSITLTILMTLAGLGAILIPLAAGLAATVVIGWLMIFSGVMHLFYCWHRHGVVGIVSEILVGIIYLIAGGYLLANPAEGLSSLTLALAFYLIAKAILEVFLALALRNRAVGWLWFDIIVNLILAVMIWSTWPASSAWAIGTLVGFGITITGFTRLMLALAARDGQEQNSKIKL